MSQGHSDSPHHWEPLAPPVAAERMPRHVAIIMDGNGRWAQSQGWLRVRGHQAGADAVRDIVRYGGQIGLKYLTLYAFSTENWKRPPMEVRFLFRLLKQFLVRERPELIENGVRLSTIGERSGLPSGAREELERSIELTQNGRGIQLCLALNYGAHDELLRAAEGLAQESKTGTDAGGIEAQLFTAGMPPVDLLIRTAGEQRLSNFLLWQSTEAEFVSEPVCWPEFRKEHLARALVEYSRRTSLV